ncbi:MAG: acyltransferase domain-containing protein [Lachnospiraceae bacterium]|nr:acyltransferase domain-containing protein [Lachnospiraceae bacterium]
MKEKVAIVGIGCVFPDAPDFTEYWKNIVEGHDSIHDISGEFWEAEDFYDTDKNAPDKSYSKMGATVAPIEFDAMEFGISPKVMQATSTEQLFTLIAARQAMIDAGIYGKDAKSFNKEKTGIIISAPAAKNAFNLCHRTEEHKIRRILLNNGIPSDVAENIVEKYKATLSEWSEDNNPGYIPNVVAGRIANRFDFGGTSCSVDAACGSSMAAIKFAVDELQNGNCDVMLAGGANLDTSSFAYISFCKTPAISKTDKIKPFDKDADGMILGDGVGIVILKRLSDAKRDGDKIYAVVRGVGSSSDGRAKSIYAPSKDGQIRALERAYENAGVSPETIGLVEAHGTGTAKGDACEVSAISEVYKRVDGKRSAVIGSVKSQIGHLRMAAGIASFIKTALALHEKVRPGSLNIENPNPTIVDSSLCVLPKAKAWIVNDKMPVRRAACSAFGFGGTNFHIVLEEYQSDYDEQYRVTPAAQGVMISGTSKAEVITKIEELAGLLKEKDNRRVWKEDKYSYHKIDKNIYRLAFVARDEKEVIDKCNKALKLLNTSSEKSWTLNDITYSEKPVTKDKVSALFSGQGTQSVDMLSDVAIGYPNMRKMITKADNVMLADGATPVSELVYPLALTDEEKKVAADRLQNTANTQPVLATLEAGLYDIMSERGFKADMMIGHSFGELVALWADGVFDTETLVKLAKQRGLYMSDTQAGTAMVAVMADKTTVANYVSKVNNVFVANENSPAQTVVSGDAKEIDKLIDRLTSDGIKAVKLNVSGAFHSPYMAEAASKFKAFLGTQNIKTPTNKVIANYNGDVYGANVIDTLVNQIVNPVLFTTSINKAYENGVRVFVEIGNGKVLSNLTKDILGDRECEIISVCPDKNKNSMDTLEFALARLAVLGYDINEDKYRFKPEERMFNKKTRSSYTVASDIFILPEKQKLENEALAVNEEDIKRNRESMLKAALEAGIKVPGLEDMSKDKGVMPANTEVKTPVENTIEKTEVKRQVVDTIVNEEGKMNNMSNIKNVQTANAEVFGKFMDVQTAQLNAVAKMLEVSNAKSESEKKHILDMVTMFQNNSLQAFQTFFGSTVEGVLDSNVVWTDTAKEVDTKEIEIIETVVEAKPVVSTAPVAEIETVKEVTPIKAEEEKVEVSVSTEVNTDANNTAEVKEEAVVSNNANGYSKKVEELVLDVISDKTGYPTEMIEVDMEMEADLGIDSIKRVEILSDINKGLGSVFAEEDIANLSTIEVISEMISYLSKFGGETTVENSSVEVVADTNVATTAVETSADTSRIESVLMEAISDKTGYPIDMIDTEMELEADLGIDSIKRVEIFADVNKALSLELSTDDAEELAEQADIRSIIAFLAKKC